MSKYLCGLIGVFLVVPLIASASSVMRTGDSINVAVDQAVEGDFYGVANTVIISGEVTEDLLLAAAKINHNGQTGGDLAVIAGSVHVSGVVGDDMRVVAGEVTVEGEVTGDLVVLSGTLNVLSTANISGDILFFGDSANISGNVGKSIYGASDSIRVDGVVGGDVDVKTLALTLGDRAEVAGLVKYTSVNELVRSPQARVAGKIVKNDPVAIDVPTMRDVVVPFLVLLFAALVWQFMFSKLLTKVVNQVADHTGRSFLIGLGIMLVVPMVAIILIVSALGSLLGVTLIFMYLALMLMATTLGGVVLGAYIYKLFSRPVLISIPLVIMGTAVFFALPFIPFVGIVCFIAIHTITLGALATHIYRSLRFI